MNKKTFRRFTKAFKGGVIDTHDRLGDMTAIVDKDQIVEMCEYLRNDDKMSFEMLADLTVVDYLQRQPRFEVVYHLYSMTHKHRLRLRAPVEEGDETIPSVHHIWKCANWAEREAWDMYGIAFQGHPDPRRMLMYEEFEGHPLRKDYPIQKSQPRMDLRKKERDAVEDYQELFVAPRREADA